MTPPDDLAALRTVSARFGADPLLVQGPGGNTSVKTADVMWIKASGARLADAETRDVFVPVDLARLKAVVERDDPLADQPGQFALRRDGLRPSIETCLHSVFPHRVVIHVHCVRTLAIAVCADARERLALRLAGFAWTFVDYVKPGARLAAKVRAARRPRNRRRGVRQSRPPRRRRHCGLGGAAYRGGRRRARRAAARCRCAGFRPSRRSRRGWLRAGAPRASPAWRRDVAAPAGGGDARRALSRPRRVLRPRLDGVAPGDDATRLANRFAARGLAPPPFLLAPGAGALLRENASSSALAIARCLGDVLARMPGDGSPRYLTDDEVSELLDWDAEKYRQALNAR